MAIADIDNDGDLDILMANNNGRARLLLNRTGTKNNWLGIRLVDEKNGRDLVGSRVVLHRKDGKPLTRGSRTEGSYCSANDPRILFGLGDSDQVDFAEITWSDGTQEKWETPKTNRYTTLRRHNVNR